MADGGDVAYSFPLLSPRKIVEFLSNMNIHISDEVLADPQQHASQVSVVYEKLVETATGVTKEDMSQPAFAGLNVLTYPDLHEENIAFMALFRAVSKMMKISRIDDFSLKDMSEPKRNRLRRQLSAVINFVRFREGKESMYQDAIAKKRAAVSKTREEQVRHNQLVEDLEDLQDKMAEKKKVIAEVKSRTAAVKQETAELSRNATAIREECAELKKASFAAKDRVSGAQATLEQAEIKRERLQGQVVTSPQRIVREVAEQQQALEQELADISSEVKRTQKLQHTVAVTSKAKREVSKAAASIDEAGTELSKQESAFQEVVSTQRKIVERKRECAARSSEIAEEQRKLARFEEKIAHLRKQAAFRTEASAGELDAVRTAITENEKQLAESHARLDEAQAVMDQLKQEKEDLESHLARQVEETRRLIEMVGTICRSHALRLEAAMREDTNPSSTVLA